MKEKLEALLKEGAEKILLLGDILYHGPRNDLPAGYAPKKVIELLNAVAPELLCVRGNCDTEVDQMVLSFPVLADYAWISLDGINIFVTHGHKFGKASPPPMKRGDILLCGHTHVPAFESFGDGNIYVNPGSVSIPKEGSQKQYIILDRGEVSFVNLDGEVLQRAEIPQVM